MLRLAVARLRFCSNSFTPRRTRSEDVAVHEWHSGDASFDHAADHGGELAGVRQFLASRPNWQATLLRSASAPNGGPLTGALFSAWLNEVETGLKRGRFDAVYLSLHGACQAEGDPTADLTILRRVRSIMGPLPVVASFDWRANLSEEVAILLDGATSNHPSKKNSEAEAAVNALGLLENIANGTHRPVGALARLPMLVMGGEIALHEVIDAELRNVRHPVLAASVFTGFAWGDSPFTGASALVWADRDSAAARETAARLAMAVSRAPRVPSQLPISMERAMRIAVAASDPMARPGQPILLTDAADDPANGGLLDTPDLLRGLQRAEAFGQLHGRAVLAALHDPEIVAAGHRLGLGATLSGNFGGQTSALYGPSVPVVASVAALGKLDDGNDFLMLRAGRLDIVVLSRRPSVITPALLTACGCDLASAQVLAIKGGDTMCRAFAGMYGLLVSCDCPGPSHPDLLRLPYHFVPAVRRTPPGAEPRVIVPETVIRLSERPRRRGDDRRAGMVPSVPPFGVEGAQEA